MTDILALKSSFSRDGILMAFNGAFNHSLIEELGNAAKTYLESEQITPQTIIDVFAVYIEQTQNVRNYTAARGLRELAKDSAVVIIGYSDGEYTLCSGNYILTDDIPLLRRQLDEIAELDKAGLRKLYKQQLRKEAPPGATGAGVGLIDMARRATKPMEYRFDSDSDAFGFFTLEVKVAGE